MEVDTYAGIIKKGGQLADTLQAYVARNVAKKYKRLLEIGNVGHDLSDNDMMAVASQLAESFIVEVLPDNVSEGDMPKLRED